jgi:hypothetical protein
MLQRNEDADAAGRRVDGARERYDEEQRVIVDDGEHRARGKHQACGRKQQLPMVIPGAEQSDAHRQER